MHQTAVFNDFLNKLRKRCGLIRFAGGVIRNKTAVKIDRNVVAAADLGSPPAMFYVAMMHHQGMGVKRDDIRAISLLSRAADAGSEDAQFYLARTYESNSYARDESQIVKLYADAASNGFLAAYYYLSKYEDHPERYVRRTHMRR